MRAVIETWRDGICDGRPETVTPYPDRESAVHAAETAWGHLTEQERRRYRVLAVESYDGVDWGRAEWIWDSEEVA
ncbi:MAG: hypothetical protein IKP53_08425 [Candidatus Methanomethylophilaceae archaeon]|nr:hypothetical protein [Candidatus Methanomethylophilaceae archaeon]